MQSRYLENEPPGKVGKLWLSEENLKKEQNLLRIPPSVWCFFRKWVAYSGRSIFSGIGLLEERILSLAARRSTQEAESSADENPDFLRIFLRW